MNISIFLGLINTFVKIRFHISTSQTNGMETIKEDTFLTWQMVYDLEYA